MLLFRGVVAELRSARHDACSPLFRGPRNRMTAAVIQVTGVCVCVCCLLGVPLHTLIQSPEAHSPLLTHTLCKDALQTC